MSLTWLQRPVPQVGSHRLPTFPKQDAGAKPLLSPSNLMWVDMIFRDSPSLRLTYLLCESVWGRHVLRAVVHSCWTRPRAGPGLGLGPGPGFDSWFQVWSWLKPGPQKPAPNFQPLEVWMIYRHVLHGSLALLSPSLASLSIFFSAPLLQSLYCRHGAKCSPQTQI